MSKFRASGRSAYEGNVYIGMMKGREQAARVVKLLNEGEADKRRLDWLEKQEGDCLISDDFGHWAVSSSGFQNVPDDQRNNPQDVQTTFFVEAADWKNSARKAIDAAIASESEPAGRESK